MTMHVYRRCRARTSGIIMLLLLPAAVLPVLYVRAAPDSQTDFARQIARHMTRIHHIYNSDNQDSLEVANDDLHTWLMAQCGAHPEVMKMDLPGLDTLGLKILTSDDRKFRIYGWDTHTGGSMHFYYALIQYISGAGKTEVKDLVDRRSMEDGGEPGYWYSAIHTVHAKSGETFYLPVFHGRYSGKDFSEGISAYTISSGGKLSDTTVLFYTPRKAYHTISYSYEAAGDVSALPQIRLSDDKQTLYIPVVTGKGAVTARSLIYHFNGEKFVYTGK